MSDFVGVDIAGLPEVQRILKNAVPVVQDAVVEGVATYLVNALQSEQPTYRYVSRAQAYGVTFFSEKQRRYVMMMINKGEIRIPYKRTQALRRGWKKYGQGKNAIVANEEPAAVYAYDDERQARQLGLVGWRKLGVTLKERNKRMSEIAEAEAKKALKKLDK